MFERAMHSNGISYDIIRKKLPVINEEIAKVLANIVSFEIFYWPIIGDCYPGCDYNLCP